MLTRSRAVLQNFADATQHEWLETNGLGGWASSSIIGANTRRYHGLLVAAVVPPAERMVLLSKLDETIVTGDKRIELGVNLYLNNVIAPQGHQHLSNFTKELFPQWHFETEGIKLKKTIAAVHGENTTLIMYDVLEAEQPFTLELLPLITARGYHYLYHQGPQLHWDVQFENGIFHNQPDGVNNVYISIPGAEYRHAPQWFNNFQYAVEEARGLDFTEDLLNHGTFTVELKKGDTLGIILSTEDPAEKNADELFSKEMIRRKLLISNEPEDELVMQLTLAADQFIVNKSENLKTVIAGYHWFTDWGRDTMISLPGLCLSTGRFEDAKKILSSFASSVSMGMLPNRFPEDGKEPEYNNADGTLWFFVAVYKYLQATGDTSFVMNELLPVLKQIIDWHYKGTRFNIHVDDDSLLFAGEEGVQLTWMDARIGDLVVTPRMGKPVEIQALWYNALRIFAELLQINGQQGDALVVSVSAAKVKESFEQKFWHAEGNYLYDNIAPNGEPSTEFRPNQLFAISLPFPLIEGDKARMVLQMVEEQLYTPVGLRTLPASDIKYKPIYNGNQYHRDAAYHEGTVWSWLLGAYTDAIVRTQGLRFKAQEIIDNFKFHLNEACIGSVSEIFDGEAPHRPRGCIAQAWSVAELLRVVKEYQLYTLTVEKTELRMAVSEETIILTR